MLKNTKLEESKNKYIDKYELNFNRAYLSDEENEKWQKIIKEGIRRIRQ